MKFISSETIIKGDDGLISLGENKDSVPIVKSKSLRDAAYGLGWVHGRDRQLQLFITRLILQGRISEKAKDDDEFVEFDRYMRKIPILADFDKEVNKLLPAVREQIEAYVRGINDYIENNKKIFEFSLIGFTLEPWTVKDTMVLGAAFGILGLSDTQIGMEKFIVQLIQQEVSVKKIKELFPTITDTINVNLIKKIKIENEVISGHKKWLGKIPHFLSSNNWVISGAHTKNGNPILACDPHLPINRIPSIHQEIIIRVPGNSLIGASLPGIPGLVMGRTNSIAFGPTFSFMDLFDYRIEDCKDGKYRRGRKWIPFAKREEVVTTKKGRTFTDVYYENDLGVLEGDPYKQGKYLLLSWSTRTGCGAGDFNCLLTMPHMKTAKEVMKNFQRMEANTFSWVISDIKGNIGFQMTGRMFKRPKGVSGLVPTPAWDEKYFYKGYESMSSLPSLYNPKDGIIVTANNDLNQFGKANPINLPTLSYRHDRIKDLLKNKKNFILDDMKAIHYDVYSLQAEKFMKIIKPLIPQSENGNVLRAWDCRYSVDSMGATIFENVYMEILRLVFGEIGFGEEVWDYLIHETYLFIVFFGNFDQILFKNSSTWFEGKTREELFKLGIQRGLKKETLPFGKNRKIILKHLLFGDYTPNFLRFNYGPFEMYGNRATVNQLQFLKFFDKDIVSGPELRFICDLKEDGALTNICGGVSDRRFSRKYLSDVKNWFNGKYKRLV